MTEPGPGLNQTAQCTDVLRQPDCRGADQHVTVELQTYVAAIGLVGPLDALATGDALPLTEG